MISLTEWIRRDVNQNTPGGTSAEFNKWMDRTERDERILKNILRSSTIPEEQELRAIMEPCNPRFEIMSRRESAGLVTCRDEIAVMSVKVLKLATRKQDKLLQELGRVVSRRAR